MLQKYTKVKDDYNLSKDEIEYNKDQFIDAIIGARNKLTKKIKSTQGEIQYKLEGGVSEEGQKQKLKQISEKEGIRFLRGKFAALKSILFLFDQFSDDEVDEALVALVGFALSLTGVNPTFFKVTGQKSGKPKSPDKFPRGKGIVIATEGNEQIPIIITDSDTFGGLVINFNIEKEGKPYSVTINARNNGNVQGTLEIQKIKPV